MGIIHNITMFSLNVCWFKYFEQFIFTNAIKVYVNQLTAEERSKVIKLTEKQCRQMMTLIYKKKMEYFKSGGEDWKEVSQRLKQNIYLTKFPYYSFLNFFFHTSL